METLEERMLNAFAKLSASKGEGAATFNFKTAAKACANIAEEEIEKYLFPFFKNRLNKWQYSYKDGGGLNQHSEQFTSFEEAMLDFGQMRMIKND